ncbi:MAG: hydroxyacid dehydrogenase [Clostridia bacterium]|nr:hydroxyacid dehydrogenase [Clostridia bacterium]
MKYIYLTKKRENIQAVFQTEETVYTKEDLLAAPQRFAEVETVFSTWGMPAMTEEEIRRCLPRLKAVFYGAGSVQSFARPFLACGVRIFSAWAANAVPVAEYTVAQIILANKGFFKTMRYSDKTTAKELFSHYPGNYEVKIGIIGAGMIGTMVIERLKSYDLQVLVFDPFLSEEKAAKLEVEKTSLERLFAECSVVSNHLANNEQTQGILHGRLFETMLPYATFINTGRGAQVVEEELIATLTARPDLTAILDVTHPEPPLEGSPLYTLPNCILTPHIAGSSGREVARMGQYMKEEYERFCQGVPCLYEVTLKMLETMA